MNKIIGFTGKAGAGKTTAASTLFWEHDFIIGSFAKRMKQAVSEMFDIPLDVLTGDYKTKAIIDPRYGLSYRQILQRFGTEACRGTFGDDIWVKIFWAEFGETPLLVIDDVRFEQEAQSIIDRGGKIIEIVRPDLEDVGDSHSSEAGLPRHLIYATVVNESSVPELYNKIEEFI